MSCLPIIRGCCTIQLSDGSNTLIDESDYPEFSKKAWGRYLGGNAGSRGYARNIFRIPGAQRSVSLHRKLLNADKGLVVDHKNGDSLDNRRINLRTCDQSQNLRNKRSSSGDSKFKGVSRSKNKKKTMWRARIRVQPYTELHLGVFPTEEEAARAYDDAARRYFGEFALTNSDLHGNY